MEVTIDHNYLRLAAPIFMHISPLRDSRYQLEQLYNCVAGRYGKVGEVILVASWDQPVHAITKAVQFLVGGDQLYATKMLNDGFKLTEMIQVCTFQFASRMQQPFIDLVTKEAAKINISFAHQTSLFPNT